MQLTDNQKTQLAAVLSDDERIGATKIHCPVEQYAASAFEVWHRDAENERFIDPVSAFVSARQSALATMKSIPADSLALLKCTEGVDPISIAKRWNLVTQARRRF